jgi:hypothetical protein
VAEVWNTGCNVVYNRTAKRLLRIIDGEDQSRTLVVEPSNEESFKGTIVPWADKDSEVTSKAFRVMYYSNTTGKFKGWFYIFQNYNNNLVSWVDWTSASPFDEATPASEAASYIDVQIDADEEGNPTVEIVKVS